MYASRFTRMFYGAVQLIYYFFKIMVLKNL
jgi:hypothetical protein